MSFLLREHASSVCPIWLLIALVWTASASAAPPLEGLDLRTTTMVVVGPEPGFFGQRRLGAALLSQPPRRGQRALQRAVPDFVDRETLGFQQETADPPDLPPPLGAQRPGRVRRAILRVGVAYQVDVHRVSVAPLRQ